VNGASTKTCISIAVAALCWTSVDAVSAAGDRSHGLSVFGDLKYAADFAHFDHVNPKAPKGGLFRTRGYGAFDSLHPFILKGKVGAGPRNQFQRDYTGVWESLMVWSQDEPDAVYGLIAESVTVADDGAQARFYLRPEAAFHDGTPITAADVVFSFETLKAKGHPKFRNLLRDVAAVNAAEPQIVDLRFRAGAPRNAIVTAASEIPILSRAYFKDRPFDKTTMTAPLASGPYRVGKVEAGRQLVYERMPDYWGRHLAVNRGRWNFDRIQVDFYRDRGTALIAFFADAYDFREEFTSKSWATAYDDKPPIKDGRIVRETLPDASMSGTQAWFFNTRRPKFSDRRVRAALDLAFDFEWTNKNLFYGLYKRTNSMFANSTLAQAGPPSVAERALLEPYRGSLPAKAFDQEYRPPVTDGSGAIRGNLRQAAKLLRQAGWRIKDGALKNPDGEIMTIEFLIWQPSFERIIAPYVRNLEKLGIQASIRRVDSAQYQNRQNSFDFDVVTIRFSLAETPGVGLLSLWHSREADVAGSFNLAGVKNPAVDGLLEKIMAAPNRDGLVTAVRALDRVLMWNHYAVPQWYKGAHNIAYWNRFSRPPTKPKFGRGVVETWWYDAAKAKASGAERPSDKQ